MYTTIIITAIFFTIWIEHRSRSIKNVFLGMFFGTLLGLCVGHFIPADYETTECEYSLVTSQDDGSLVVINHDCLQLFYDDCGENKMLQIVRPSVVSVKYYDSDTITPRAVIITFENKNKFSEQSKSCAVEIFIPKQ